MLQLVEIEIWIWLRLVSDRSATVRLIDQKQEMVCVLFVVRCCLVAEILLRGNAVWRCWNCELINFRLGWYRRARRFVWQMRLTLTWYAFCYYVYLAQSANEVYMCEIWFFWCKSMNYSFETNIFSIVAGNFISRCRSPGSQDYGLQVRNFLLAIIWSPYFTSFWLIPVSYFR